jgi:LPXTG-site transpeptidase (sortase) family protein
MGDVIQIAGGGREFTYQVAEVHTVARTDVSVVQPTSSPTLTLITCTGAWQPEIGDYAERLVVRAELIPGP